MVEEAVLEANKNLNKKIKGLEKQLESCWFFKEKYEMLQKQYQSFIKLKDPRIEIMEEVNGAWIVKQIVDVEEAPGFKRVIVQ